MPRPRQRATIGSNDRDSPMEKELPDIPDTRASPAVSDITVLRLVLFVLKNGILYFFFKVIFFLIVTFLILALLVPAATAKARCIIPQTKK